MYPEAVQDCIPEVYKLTKLVKDQWPTLSEYESIQIALKMWMAHSLGTLHDIAVNIDDNDEYNPLHVRVVSDD